jgi:hypothetical protein
VTQTILTRDRKNCLIVCQWTFSGAKHSPHPQLTHKKLKLVCRSAKLLFFALKLFRFLTIVYFSAFLSFYFLPICSIFFPFFNYLCYFGLSWFFCHFFFQWFLIFSPICLSFWIFFYYYFFNFFPFLLLSLFLIVLFLSYSILFFSLCHNFLPLIRLRPLKITQKKLVHLQDPFLIK